MKVAFFEALEDILQSTSFTQIREKFMPFYDDVKRGCVDFTSSTCVRPSSDLESLWIMRDNNTSALKIRRPNHAKSKLALAKVLHSVTHIEASAIILALDACYRFRDMPLAFYMDWLSVADEELKHFGLLEELLGELDSVYGAFPVHNTLFEAMQATQASLEWRMGVVHRGLEAKVLCCKNLCKQTSHLNLRLQKYLRLFCVMRWVMCKKEIYGGSMPNKICPLHSLLLHYAKGLNILVLQGRFSMLMRDCKQVLALWS